MLHGMIPAAFFAALLRRYLDSISETSSQYASSSSTLGSLGTSAIVATVGVAAYGVSRLSRKKVETPQMDSGDKIRPEMPPKEEPCNCVNTSKKTPGKVTRKRHRKNKKWFLKHMRHYKSKYGRQIGKLMNQYLGVPLAEPQAPEPVDLEESDEEDDVDLEPLEVFDCPPYNGDTQSAVVTAAFNDEDSAAPFKDRFEDDYDTDGIGMVRRKSSSFELKDLLRDNFEMQMKRRRDSRDTFDSLQSPSSSGSYKSGCSEDSRTNHRSSSKDRRSSAEISDSRGKLNKKRPRKKRQLITNSRRTRSGRCYCKS